MAELRKEDLWVMADKLRNNMDSAEYKHVCLGLIFLKYISDSFERAYQEISQDEYADPEDRDEYLAKNVFWVPQEARWETIKNSAKDPTIGQVIDNAMYVIEKENSSLRGVLPKDFARASLDKRSLGELLDLLSELEIGNDKNKDTLGSVYEYFLGKFARAEGKLGGEFYTPRSVVELIVAMIEPHDGRVYDPCCGSGGMFVQSERFVEDREGRIDGQLAIYGQESNYNTWKLCKMNLAIRGIEANLGQQNADSFHNDQHKSLKADYIMANPPFNISDWGGERLIDDPRWSKYGIPPTGNANYDRVFKDKPGGLIVDYIGIADNLRSALAQYTPSDRKTTGIDPQVAIDLMLEKYEQIQGILHGLAYSSYISGSASERMACIVSGVDFVLGKPEDEKKEFLNLVVEIGKAYALCSTSEQAQAINVEISYFKAIAIAQTNIFPDFHME